MKKIFKTILQYYLKYITKLALAIHRPVIIAVAGSSNKTFVKDEIVRTLNSLNIPARANPRNFNTEIGMPLAILYVESGYNSYKEWAKVVIIAFLKIWQKNFPKFLVLEFGISDPGDMNFLLSIARPNIAVITDITKRYLENFSNIEKIENEYKYIVERLPRNGLLIFNYDNNSVRLLKKYAKCKTVSFGFVQGAQWLASDLKQIEGGQHALIISNNYKKHIKCKKFGYHHIYAALTGLIIKEYVADKKRKQI